MAVKKITKKNIDTDKKKYVCFCCGEELLETEFYNSRSQIYKDKLPLCKECIWKLFKRFTEEYKSVYKAIFRICGIFDMYYEANLIDSVYDKYTLEGNTDITYIVKSYIRQINSLLAYKNKTFQDSDVKQKEANIKSVDMDGQEQNKKNWGANFSKKQCEILNDKYEDWCSSSPHETHADVITLRNLCKLELQIDEKMGLQKDTSKLTDQLMKMISLAGLDGKSRKKMDDGTKANDSFGSFIKMVEETRPCEKHADTKLYKDWMGYGENYKNYYIRPLRNMVENRRDFPDVEKHK